MNENNILNKEDLLKKVAELEMLLKKKDEELRNVRNTFLSKIGHELRTPMNSIIGFSNILANNDLTADQKELYLEYINSSSDELLHLVENMIDLAMLESGQTELNEVACSVNALFNELYAHFNREKHVLEKFSVALLMSKSVEENDLVIKTDPLRLKQVLSNLISNALKFTDKGVIEFGYEVDKKKQLYFFVKDSGKGVSVDLQNTIFNSFRKDNSESGNQQSGIGIGLAIAKEVVKLMGGDIGFKPNPKRGSLFYFTLPIRKVKVNSESFLIKHNRKDCFLSEEDIAI
ncbi:MAG: HAMP domain-containing histidine kinase [Bacteroidetes bacterium]|nr:HAMP domain-containing histidine kinase [Bacteroidota bacterium]